MMRRAKERFLSGTVVTARPLGYRGPIDCQPPSEREKELAGAAVALMVFLAEVPALLAWFGVI